MQQQAGKISSIDDYINSQQEAFRERLRMIRAAIREAAPGAEETISYQIPAFRQYGRILLQFGAGKYHIGIYPTPSAVEAFKDDLTKYKTAKGSIQLPMDKPLPLPLIRRIAKFRVKEAKSAVKAK